MRNINRISDHQKEFIINLCCKSNQRMSYRMIHEESNLHFKDLGLKPISYNTVRRIINSDIETKGRSRKGITGGSKFIRTAFKGDPNETIWLVDDAALEMMCFDEKGELMKPFLSVIMELRSKKVVKHHISSGTNKESRLEFFSKAFKNSISYPDKIFLDPSSVNKKFIQGIREKIPQAFNCEFRFLSPYAMKGTMERLFYNFNKKFLNYSINSSYVKNASNKPLELTIRDLHKIAERYVKNYNDSL